MKKLLFVAAAAAGMVAVADVESANTVGYTQIEIKPGLNLIGTSFFKVNTMGRPDINATFSDCKEKACGGTGSDVADFIQVFDNTKKSYPNAFYYYVDKDYPDPEYDFLWCNLSNDETADFVIPSANAFWYTSRGDQAFSLTTSGAVGPDDVQFTLKPGLNLIVNPFPCDLPLNSKFVNWKEAGIVGGTGSDVADFIQVFDANKKSYPNAFYYYVDKDYPDPEYDFLWCNLSNDETTDFAVPAGGGFWYTYRGTEDMTITFKSPLKK